MDWAELLSVVLPPDSVAAIWNALNTSSKISLRSSCKLLRDRIDSLLGKVSLHLANPAPDLGHIARFLQRLEDRVIDLRVTVEPQTGNHLLLQLLSSNHLLQAVRSLSLDCRGGPCWIRPISHLDGEALPLLARNLPSLIKLAVRYFCLAPAALHALSVCSSLRQLDLNVTMATPGLGAATFLPAGLTHLDIRDLRYQESQRHLDLACLNNLKDLQNLYVDCRGCVDTSALAHLTYLTYLNLRHLDRHQEHSFLRHLTGLRQLVLSYIGGSPQVLLLLPQLQNLVLLHISACDELPEVLWTPGSSPQMPALQEVIIDPEAMEMQISLQTVHWLLMTGCNLKCMQYNNSDACELRHVVWVPNPQTMDGGQAAVVQMLCETALRLMQLETSDGALELSFYQFRLVASSIVPYLAALAPLRPAADRFFIGVQDATVDEPAVTALASAVPGLKRLWLEGCSFVNPLKALPRLAHHPGLRDRGELYIDGLNGSTENTAAIFALAALAPDMFIHVTAAWWGKEYGELLDQVQKRSSGQ